MEGYLPENCFIAFSTEVIDEHRICMEVVWKISLIHDEAEAHSYILIKSRIQMTKQQKGTFLFSRYQELQCD